MLLDEIDKQLLTLIQLNSKLTNKELALKTNLSVTAIFERIKKLEREGIISKYVSVLDRNKIDKKFMVLCHVKLIQHTKECLSHFEKQVAQLPEVLECFHVSGDYDYLLKVYVKDMEAYREFMVNKLTSIQYIGSTQSSFTISEIKNTTSFTL